MNRLFGSSKPKGPKPTLDDAITKVDSRVEAIDVKIRKLDGELAQYKDQLAKMPEGPSKNGIKQRAIRTLQQKRQYEAQREQMRSQSFNMEQTNFATSSLKDTQLTVNALRTAAKEMKATSRKLDIDKVQDLQDEMQELMEDSNEVQEILGRSYAIGAEVDEADLEAELEALGELGELEPEPSYLNLPEAGSSAKATPIEKQPSPLSQ